MPRRRDGGDGDFVTANLTGLLQPCADFIIQGADLGIGLGDEKS